MDKNNDIQVNKVNKWDYGVVDMSLWHLKDEFDALVDKLNGVYGIDVFEIEELTADTCSSMDKVLDRFNELEVEHQKDTGMISEYEEENKNLKSELDIKTDECDALISRVFNQDDEYTRLEAENEKLRLECGSKDDTLKKMTQEVTELEKEKIELEDRLVQQKRLEVRALVNANTASTYRSEIKQVIELIKSYGLIIHDDRKDAIPDDVVNVGMCGHYYILGGRDNDELKQHYEDELRIRCKEIDDKNKLIKELEKENKDLKTTLAMCERDANMVRSLSHNIAFNAERARNKTSYVKAGIRL